MFIACRGQKKGSDPLELDLQMVVCCVGARTPEEQPMLLPTKPFLEPGLSALVQMCSSCCYLPITMR